MGGTAIFKNDVGIFDSLIIITEYVNTTIDGVLIYFKSDGIGILQKTLSFFIKGCEVGEIFFQNVCKVCPTGFYSYSLYRLAQSECKPCPSEAQCKLGKIYKIQKGFWRKNFQVKNWLDVLM